MPKIDCQAKVFIDVIDFCIRSTTTNLIENGRRHRNPVKNWTKKNVIQTTRSKIFRLLWIAIHWIVLSGQISVDHESFNRKGHQSSSSNDNVQVAHKTNQWKHKKKRISHLKTNRQEKRIRRNEQKDFESRRHQIDRHFLLDFLKADKVKAKETELRRKWWVNKSIIEKKSRTECGRGEDFTEIFNFLLGEKNGREKNKIKNSLHVLFRHSPRSTFGLRSRQNNFQATKTKYNLRREWRCVAQTEWDVSFLFSFSTLFAAILLRARIDTKMKPQSH